MRHSAPEACGFKILLLALVSENSIQINCTDSTDIAPINSTDIRRFVIFQTTRMQPASEPLWWVQNQEKPLTKQPLCHTIGHPGLSLELKSYGRHSNHNGNFLIHSCQHPNRPWSSIQFVLGATKAAQKVLTDLEHLATEEETEKDSTANGNKHRACAVYSRQRGQTWKICILLTIQLLRFWRRPKANWPG